MARKNINLGTPPNGDDGMDARSAFEVCQENFVELYGAALPDDEAQRAAARARMGLGSAAMLTATTSSDDNTAGRAVRMGDRGIGRIGARYLGDMNDLRSTQVRAIGHRDQGVTNSPPQLPAENSAGICVVYAWENENAGNVHQLFMQTHAIVFGGNRLFHRLLVGGVSGDWVELHHTGNSSALPISGSLSPATDNSVSYGTAARRPTQLFAATATIGTSDAREKTPVRALTEAEYAVGLQLAREIGAYCWLEAVERKGDGAREHFGQTVQRAMAIFQQHGLDPFAYGAICYDTWKQETVEHPAQYEQIEIPAVLDEQGNEIEPARYEQGKLIREAWTEVTLKAGDRYSWRDSELFWLICAAQQRQADEQARQQADILARLEALERSA